MKVAQASPREGTVAKRLAAIFEVSDENLLEIVRRLMVLSKLGDETEHALHQIEGLDTELFLRPFPHIRTTLTGMLGNLYAAWLGFHQQVGLIDFGALEFCSDKLSQYPTEEIIPPADLDQILEDVDSLFDDVDHAELSPDLRAFILDSLESIRRAIAEYRIRGLARLREELGTIVGRQYINYDIVEPAKDVPQVSKLYMIFYKLKQAVEFAGKVKQLADPFIKLLGNGHGLDG